MSEIRKLIIHKLVNELIEKIAKEVCVSYGYTYTVSETQASLDNLRNKKAMGCALNTAPRQTALFRDVSYWIIFDDGSVSYLPRESYMDYTPGIDLVRESSRCLGDIFDETHKKPVVVIELDRKYYDYWDGRSHKTAIITVYYII